QVFEEWTEIYTDYGYQKEADFYNRLRNGSMPLGIAPYSTYMTIYSAAPEIDGRWAVALVPGTHDPECEIEGCKEESHINRTIAGAGTGAGIIKRSANKEAAWKFLQWWTSTETQKRYSSNVESIIGLLGRVATANKNAFSELAWDPDDLAVLMEQWSKVSEVPEVPGSYYMTRAIDQAFWSVLNDNTNAKDAINEWSLVADKEIKRKIEEYS
ncbi:MAG: extracellular solute-binding protein, partial [Clostridia bacterium]|nr:extracellular solute-binding protein [Clostridia bacterium]